MTSTRSALGRALRDHWTGSGAADNLHLKGPGVDRKTGVAFKGQAHWTVTLKAGSYRVLSDAHRALARTIRVA